MSDISKLLGRLQQSQDSQPSTPNTNYHPPTVSSPLFSPPPPPPAGPERRSSGIMSYNATPTSNNPVPQSADQSTSLLNLLKFTNPAQSPDASMHLPGLGRSNDNSRASPAPSSATKPAHIPKKDSTQDMLLNLLRHNKTASDVSTDIQTPDRKRQESPPVRVFGSPADHQSPFEPPTSATQARGKVPVFSYVNPFEQLAATSRGVSPSPLTAEPVSPAVPIFAANAITNVAAPTPDLAVSEAVQHIATQADKDAEDALVQAQSSQAQSSQASAQQNLKGAVHNAAVEINQELKQGATRADLEAVLPKPITKAFEATANEAIKDNVADSWESADADEDVKDASAGPTKVYNLPMKPFVSINVSNTAPQAKDFRQDVIMRIASLKKDFDQVDRCLVAATPNHIVYSMAKNGGFRVIRMDDGTNKALFRKTDNHIFNIAISETSSTAHPKSTSSPVETVLATGVDGSVYWASVPVTKDDSGFDGDLEKDAFIFPPLPPQEENTSNSQLKTRAKKSSRHPEFFAIGRGKSIHIIFPAAALSKPYIDEKTRIVDSVKFLNERCLKIATGKAGKDFAFSEDDSLIVTLDKNGRLKFWDITAHTSPLNNYTGSGKQQIEVKSPLLTYWVNSPSEKAWPTSIQFVDKERPTQKGNALRYMLVGMKQNHTIQLWDLGLGKAVQELNLPHENEADPICSIAYHAKSGVIVIGHPTRNSVYFIHLSAPRYNLPPITQATYISKLTEENPVLPKPESTAIMTGLRELSFNSIGQLRSLDILHRTVTPAEKVDDEETIFELYIMHSKGVACLDIKGPELGYGKDGKIANAVAGLDEKIVTMEALRPATLGSLGDHDEIERKSAASEATIKAAEPSIQVPPAKVSEINSTKDKVNDKTSHPATPNGHSKAEKKAKKKAKEDEEAVSEVAKVQEKTTSQTMFAPVTTPERAVEPPAFETAVKADSFPTKENASTDISTKPTLDESAVQRMFSSEFMHLYRRIDDDRRVQEAAGAAKQDAVLRLVSSTLTENVEMSLSRIIGAQIQEQVLPALNNITSAHLAKVLPNIITQQVKSTIPTAMTHTLQDPQLLRTISDQVTGKITGHIEKEFAVALHNTITPTFKNLTMETAQRMNAEVEKRVSEHLRQSDIKHQKDNLKIDELTRLATDMFASVRILSQNQGELQNAIKNLQAQVSALQVTPQQTSAPPPPKDALLDSITESLTKGKFEEGTIAWMQSSRQDELFDKIFIHVDPSYLRNMNQIITLSVTAAVTQAFNTCLAQRLAYLEIALGCIDSQNADVAEYAPQMMDLLTQRLSDAYMSISQRNPGDPHLARIHTLVRQAKELKFAAG